MGYLLWIIPIAGALLTFPAKRAKTCHAVSVAASALLVLAAAWVTAMVLRDGPLSYGTLGGLFYADALSVLVLDIVAVVSLLASIYAVGYCNEEIRHGEITAGRLRFCCLLTHLFVFSMVLALTVRNMGVLWIAIEATTLASAFLVGLRNDRNAVEAAWKYVVICSVGIAVAMLGIILLHLSSGGLLDGTRILDFTALMENAASLDQPTVRLAFLFILAGFGTKAGLAPMHTWLPDAHSQAPSPVSALLSGVLLNSAMYAILRTLGIVNRALGDTRFAGRLLIGFGLLSVGIAAVFILTQKDYKRLLAYSSIEHMGIIAIAIGIFTPLSVFGALFHMVNHSLTKSMLFLTSGSVQLKYGTKLIRRVRGLLRVLPVSGAVFLLGLFAIAGTPPFSVFASEFAILASIFQGRQVWLGTVLAILLAVVFAGIAANLFRMFFGPRPEGMEPGEGNKAGAAVVLTLLAVVAVTGLLVPEHFAAWVNQASVLVLGVRP